MAALGFVPAAAEEGRQSPIDITPGEVVNAPLPAIALDYRISDVRVVNTFDPQATPYLAKEFAALRVDVPAGSSITVNNVSYDLLQFHFHTPSEHTFNGRHAPMEVHFVHVRRNACIGDADALLVICARILPGPEHAELNKIFRLALPADSTVPAVSVPGFDVSGVLPNCRSTCTCRGSRSRSFGACSSRAIRVRQDQ